MCCKASYSADARKWPETSSIRAVELLAFASQRNFREHLWCPDTVCTISCHFQCYLWDWCTASLPFVMVSILTLPTASIWNKVANILENKGGWAGLAHWADNDRNLQEILYILPWQNLQHTLFWWHSLQWSVVQCWKSIQQDCFCSDFPRRAMSSTGKALIHWCLTPEPYELQNRCIQSHQCVSKPGHG